MLAPNVKAANLKKTLEQVIGYCNHEVRDSLEGLIDAIDAPIEQNVDYHRHQLIFETVHQLADEQINALPFAMVDLAWRQLYLDTALMLAWIAGSETSLQAGVDTSLWEAVIRRLDLALIMLGGRGERVALAVETIKAIQIDHLSHKPFEKNGPDASESGIEFGERSHKRQRTQQLLELAPGPILSLRHPPSLAHYLQQYREQPFILPGYLKWEAINRWGDRQYIESVCGPARVVPVEIGKAYTDPGWGQRIVPLSEFLDQIQGTPGLEDWYLAQHPLLSQFPELEDDVEIPEYVSSRPGPTQDSPDYEPPSGGVKVNVWVGGGRSRVVSPAHTDPYYNCYAQVVGTKRVWLAPPSCTKYMHPSAPARDASSTTSFYAANTSCFPILREKPEAWMHEPAARDFREHVLPHSLEATLNPGDLLVFPPGWWHAMRGESTGPGWSVSMWY